MIEKLKKLGILKIPNRIKYTEGSKYKLADVTAIDINNLFIKDYKTTDNETNLLKKDDLVIISFDYSGNSLGYALYIDKDNSYVAGIDTIIFTCSKVNTKALKFYLSQTEVKKQINKFSNSASMGVSRRISVNNLKEIEINLDKLKKIEENLSVFENIDLYITQCWKELSTIKFLYNETKKNIFSSAKDWDRKPLNDVCNIKSGAESKPKKISKEKKGNFKYPIFSGTSEIIGYTDKSNSFNKYILYVSRGSACGNSLYIQKKSFVINKMIMIEPENINSRFLSYQLQFFKPGIEGGGLTKFVSLDTLKKSEIYVPSKKKQQEISSIFDEFENYIKNRTDYLNNLFYLKKFILGGINNEEK